MENPQGSQDTRFVAHIDILGMSTLVEKDADKAWKMLSGLVDARDRLKDSALEFLDSKEILPISEAIKTVTFSDTIILFTKSSSDNELRSIIIWAADILHKAMCACVPVRIGLAQGKFFFNLEKSMYAGPALIEAYQVGESAQWLGISLAKSVQKQAVNLRMKSGPSDITIKWPVPIKEGIEERWVINWPAPIAHDFKVSPPISIYQFYQIFANNYGPFDQLPMDVQSKYFNTVEFINEQLRLHNESMNKLG